MKVFKDQIRIGQHSSGTNLSVLKYTFKANHPGKKVYIQGGIHGGEVTLWIFERLYHLLKKSLQTGEVTLIPIANPISWFQKVYFTTAGKFDLSTGKDWNRHFPGSLDENLASRTCHVLYREAVKADLSIDLHTSRNSSPFGIVASEKDLILAQVTGLEYNLLLDPNKNPSHREYTSTLLGQMAKLGKPSITIECGRHDWYDQNTVQTVVQGVVRLLESEQILSSKTPNSEVTPKYYSQNTIYRAPDGGFVYFFKQPSDTFSRDETLFELVKPSNLDRRIKVIARQDGIVQKISPTFIFEPGDDVMQTIDINDLKLIN